MRKYLSFILLLIGLTLQAQETYKTVKDISYIPAGETDGYRKERCKLDVYYPVGKKGFPTIVWFHGGGLEGGGKHVPEMFMKPGCTDVFLFLCVSRSYLSGSFSRANIIFLFHP